MDFEGKVNQQSSSPRLDNMDPNDHDPIWLGPPSESVPGQASYNPVGLSIPFPPQPRIGDFGGMVNGMRDLSSTLPTMPEENLDGGANDYDPMSLQYVGPSTSGSQFSGQNAWKSHSPVDGTDQVYIYSFPQPPYPYGPTGALSTAYSFPQPSNACVNPSQINSSGSSSTSPTSPMQYRSFGSDIFTSETSMEPGSWESISDKELDTEHRLTAEDMANDDELAELRDIEEGGAPRRAERRRMRNKLAQRAFRARAKVSKKDTATRLVDAEVSASNQGKELDLLRTMVQTLQTENTRLKNQIQDSNERWMNNEEANGPMKR